MTLTCQGATTAPDCQSCNGPLASHVQSFAAQLSSQGYAQETIRAKCDLLTDLSRWLQRRQLPLEALDEGRLKQFLATRRRRDQVRRGDPATGQQLLQHLRDLGNVAAPAQTFDRSPQACLTRDFERFLYSERGLSRSTAVSYLLIVHRFLGERFGRNELHLEQLRSKDLHGFILRQIQRVSRTHGKAVVTALRTFLRWLLQRGAIGADLADTLPGVATWRQSHLRAKVFPGMVECDSKRLASSAACQHEPPCDPQPLRQLPCWAPARHLWRGDAASAPFNPHSTPPPARRFSTTGSFGYRPRGNIASLSSIGAPRPPAKRLSALCIALNYA